jgi:uncharacterized protein HemY
MKKFIKNILREQMIGVDKTNLNNTIVCKQMTINSYEEALKLVKQALKNVDDKTRYTIMQQVHVPLKNLQHQQEIIASEVDKYGMSGDSLPDEADTYWHQIQNVFCKGIY